MPLTVEIIEFLHNLWYNIKIMERGFEKHDKHEFSSPHGPEVLTILQEQALFLHDISELTSNIASLDQISSERHSFEFLPLPLSTEFIIPEALKPISNQNQIERITVHIGDSYKAVHPNEEDIPPYILIDFQTQTHTYTLSRTGMDDTEEAQLHRIAIDKHQHSEPETNVIQQLEPINKNISVKEFNSLLMSIVLPNEAGDYRAYSDKQLQSADAFRSMCELLKNRAMQHTVAYEFDFKDNESVLYFLMTNDEVTTFTFKYFDPEQNQTVRIEYNNSSDLTLRFFRQEDLEKKPIIPTAADISYARLVVKKELLPMSALNIEPLNNSIVMPPLRTDAEIETDLIVREEIEKLFNQPGFNPPNTST